MSMASPRRRFIQIERFYLVDVLGELVGVGRIYTYTGVDGDPWVDMSFYTSRVFVFRVEKYRIRGEVKDWGD